MITTRQYLKQLEKPTLRKLFKLANLTEQEYWLVIYAFVEERMRDNTCSNFTINQPITTGFKTCIYYSKPLSINISVW